MLKEEKRTCIIQNTEHSKLRKKKKNTQPDVWESIQISSILTYLCRESKEKYMSK